MNQSEALGLADGLRELADFLVEHGMDIPSAYSPSLRLDIFIDEYNRSNKAIKADLRDAARAMAPCEKDYSGSYFNLRREFGEFVMLEVSVSRDKVCRKVETGKTRVIPARPAQPERVEFVTEWVCDDVSLLKMVQ